MCCDKGVRKDDRTGTGTLSVFGHQMRFDSGAGFPLVTTKKLHVRSIIHELLWFLRGDTNVGYLRDRMASPSGTSGRMRTAIWARSMARNGGRGRRATAGPSTRSPMSSRASARTPIRGG